MIKITIDLVSKDAACLRDLEDYVGYHSYVYILRELYRIVFYSKEKHENKKQLKKRISRFEKQSRLPRVISRIPINTLLVQLENAQYFYPIRRREVSLPKFES